MLNPLANVFTIEALRALRDKVKGGDAVNAAAIVAERERAMAAEVTSAEYDSANQRIDFKSGTTTLFTCDARPFVKDGMVDTVVVENGYLKITFNTDAGKQDISIPISDIFDADNYYTKSQTYSKSEVDSALAGKVDKEQGKGLSSNDFTAALKTKLEGIQNRAAAQGGQDDSLVTTGDKFFWNSWVNDNYEVPDLEPVVTIGDKDYHYVQIGNLLWTVENLDWKLSGIGIGGTTSPATPNAWYMDNDEATYGWEGNKYGLLYNAYCFSLITNALQDGWRIPSRTDINSLIALSRNDLADQTWNGNNSTGFKALPSGRCGTGSDSGGSIIVTPEFQSNSFQMWSTNHASTIGGVDTNYYMHMDSSSVFENDNFVRFGMSIRLCKDVVTA